MSSSGGPRVCDGASIATEDRPQGTVKSAATDGCPAGKSSTSLISVATEGFPAASPMLPPPAKTRRPSTTGGVGHSSEQGLRPDACSLLQIWPQVLTHDATEGLGSRLPMAIGAGERSELCMTLPERRLQLNERPGCRCGFCARAGSRGPNLREGTAREATEPTQCQTSRA